MRQLMVLSSGLSTPSSTRNLADRIADAVTSAVTARGEHLEVETVELQKLIPDLATFMSTRVSTPRLDDVRRRLSDADGLVTVTPIFQGSYAGLFKMFFDTLGTDALNGMPTIIAATAGTARHSLALDYAVRPLLVYLRANVVPTSVFAATEDFASEGDDHISRAAAQLATLIVGANPAVGGLAESVLERSSGVDLAENVTPFAQLLKGHDGTSS